MSADMSPEEIAEARRRLLSGQGQTSPSSPSTSSQKMPWEGGGKKRDFEQTAMAIHAREVDAQQQEADMKAAQGLAWAPRSTRPLVAVNDDGTPLASVNRPVDMTTSTEYGEQSKYAIKLINQAFANQDCSEIHFDAPDKLFMKYQGQRSQITAKFSSEEDYNKFVEDLVRNADTPHTWNYIKNDGSAVIRLAGGDRMLIWMPPVADHIHAAIHKVVARSWNMDSLVQNGTLNQHMANLLVAAVKMRANILICGEMGAGKSVMMSLLAQEIAQSERIAIVEEVPEIFLSNPSVTRLTYNVKSGNGRQVRLGEVLSDVLYGRYDRVMIGELHDEGAYRMIQTMVKGFDGAMCTFHAGSAASALEQIRTHVILDHHQIPDFIAADFVRRALNLIVVVERQGPQHRVVEIAEVEWRNIAEHQSRVGSSKLWEWRIDRYTDEGGQEGRFVCLAKPDENGALTTKALKNQVQLEDSWFPQEGIGYQL